MTGERKKVSVVYSLIFFVYSSSMGWPGSRPGLAVASSASVSFAGLACFAWSAERMTGIAAMKSPQMSRVRVA